MTGNTTLSAAASQSDRSVDDGYRTTYDPNDDQRPSTSVVLAVSAALGIDPSELSPRLYDVVDPDSLDAVIRSIDAGRVTFEIADCRVTVGARGGIRVDSLE